MPSLAESSTLGVPPVFPTPMRGRHEYVHDLARRLATPPAPNRYLTLVGPPGVGKSRLAVEAALACGVSPVTFLPLTSVTGVATLVDEIARALAVSMPRSADRSLGLVCDRLRERSLVLILDTFEHLIAGAAVPQLIADMCPGVRVLVTSRRRLATRSETVVDVPPLDPAAAAAVFRDNARRAGARLDRSRGTVRQIRDACARLDNLPLAIELAAAQAPTVPLNQLGLDMDDEARDEVFGAIEWSFRRLPPGLARALEALGVFTGTFDLRAVEAVLAGDPSGSQHDEPAGLLNDLVDWNLVRFDGDRTGGFRLFDSVRSFLLHRCTDDRLRALRDAHATHCRALAVEAARGLDSVDEAEWIDRLDMQLHHLRAAMAWFTGTGRADEALVIASGLGPYWLHRGLLREGGDQLASLIAQSSATGVTPSALVARGWLIRLSVDSDAIGDDRALDEAAQGLRRLLASLQESPGEVDAPARLRVCEHLSYVLRLRGHTAEAVEICDDALSECTERGEYWWSAEFGLRRALLADQCGDTGAALTLAAAVVDQAARSGNRRCVNRARQLAVLADEDRDQHRPVLCEVYDEALAHGDARGAVITRLLLAVDAEPGVAATEYAETIRSARSIGYWSATVLCLIGVSRFLTLHGSPEDAALLSGFIEGPGANAIRQLPSRSSARYERLAAVLERACGAARFRQLRARGALWSLDTAADHALAVLGRLYPTAPQPGPVSSAAPTGVAELTAREEEILDLVVEGLTNPEIADRLYISPKTVMHHTSHIYRKLGVRRRSDAIRVALEYRRRSEDR